MEDNIDSGIKTIESGVRVPMESFQRNVSPVGLYQSMHWVMSVCRELSRLQVMILFIIGSAFVINEVLAIQQLPVDTTTIYYLCLFSLSVVSMIVLLVLGLVNRLTKSSGGYRKDKRAITFSKVGATILGTGGILYEAIHITVFVDSTETCMVNLVKSSMAIAFTILQVAIFLNYSKVFINYNAALSVSALFMMCQLISTNLCVWFETIVFESVEKAESSGSNSTGDHSGMSTTAANHGVEDPCKETSDLEKLLMPYLFPMTIEYSVLAATIVAGMWVHCGVDPEPSLEVVLMNAFPGVEKIDMKFHSSSATRHVISSNGQNVYRRKTTGEGGEIKDDEDKDGETNNGETKNAKDAAYYNNHLGFILGWITIMATVVIIIIHLYLSYSQAGLSEHAETEMIAWDLFMKIVCIVEISVGFVLMKKLKSKNNHMKLMRKLKEGKPIHINQKEKQSLDRFLMNATLFALIIYELFTFIDVTQKDRWLETANALASVIMACEQTLFINWFAFEKRSTTSRDLIEKPGRQTLEIVRCVNLAIWALHTFAFDVYPVTDSVYTSQTWKIISNMTEPLAILFYFHSVGCLAEIIHKTYTKKYVGLNLEKSGSHPEIRYDGRLEHTMSREEEHFEPFSSL